MRRLVAALVMALALAGCLPATSPSAPVISASIVTPTPPAYTYSWVMVHHYQSAGFQIGPKVDGSGIHVAVYWWADCAPAYTPCVRFGFQEYDPLAAGSVHDFTITETATGYAGWCDGRLVATVELAIANPITEVGSEGTRA